LAYEDELQKWETEFKKGFSKPFILLSLAEKPNYPYQVTKSITGKTKGQISIAGSNIYPILKKLEDDGFIISQKDEESKKKIYTLTKEGENFLNSLMKGMKNFTDIVQDMINTYGGLEQ